jgi:hypothetical protein
LGWSKFTYEEDGGTHGVIFNPYGIFDLVQPWAEKKLSTEIEIRVLYPVHKAPHK